jgi:CubicO group peptidase (beta-lactamase class C family)
MKQIISFFFLILFYISLYSVDAVSQPDSLEQRMNRMFKSYDRTNGPGLAIAIIKNDSVIFTKGYGLANLEYEVPIKPSTVFDIASVSKQFAGYAIAKLINDGKISGNDDVRKYLPEVPFFGKTITINHLLQHTSGLRDWPETLVLAGWRWDEVFSFDDIMRMVKAQKELDFEPGSKHSYSNTGYNLLAAVVEKVSGVSFKVWTDENIFQPLDMKSSGFQDDYTNVIKNLAHSYEPSEKGFGNVPGALTGYGSSSLFSTVEDLSKWVIHFDKQVHLKNPVYLDMLKLGRLNDGKEVTYNFGLEMNSDRGLRNISHTGGWAGYRTIISNYPDESLSIIILSNSGDFNPWGSASQIADIFLSKKWKPAPPVVNKIKELPTVLMDSLSAKQYVGTYLLRQGKLITITYEDGNLMSQATREPKFSGEAKSDSTIWIEAYGAPMTFVKGKSGKVNMIRYRDIDVKRVTPWVPNPASFSQYTGTYFSEELSAGYKISLTDGNLEMSHRRKGELLLSPDPSAPDLFTCDSGYVQFTRNAQKKVNGYKFSGGRIKNISFRKQ